MCTAVQFYKDSVSQFFLSYSLSPIPVCLHFLLVSVERFFLNPTPDETRRPIVFLMVAIDTLLDRAYKSDWIHIYRGSTGKNSELLHVQAKAKAQALRSFTCNFAARLWEPGLLPCVSFTHEIPD